MACRQFLKCLGMKHCICRLLIDSTETISTQNQYGKMLTCVSRGYSFSAFLEVGKVLQTLWGKTLV